MRILPNNRVQEYLGGDTLLRPRQDYMMLKKHEKKTKLHLPQGVNMPTNTIAFEILDIGPGRWEFGVFIESTHKAGQMVFIVGNVAELQYNDHVYVMAREKDIVAVIE